MTSPPDILTQIHVAIMRIDTRLEAAVDDGKDHEARIRTLENLPRVSPATVWKIVTLCTTIASLIITIITQVR